MKTGWIAAVVLLAAAGIGHIIDEIVKISEEMPVSLDILLSVGWGDSNYNEAYWSDGTGVPVNDSGFNDLTLSVGFPMEIVGWSVTPSVNYVTLIDSDIRDGLSSGDKDICFAGVSIGTSF